MKRKKVILASCLLIFLVGILAAGFWKKHRLYEKYRYPNEEVYGEELYGEIMYDCSAKELEIGNAVLDKATKVAEYTGTAADSEKELGDVGALEEYYYFTTKDAVRQEADFEFITCKMTGEEGHVWVGTTILRFDADGKNAGGGGRDMLSLWYIEHQENGWHVVKVLNTP